TGTGLGRGRQRNGIGHHQFVEDRAFDVLDGAPGQDRVSAIRIDLFRAMIFQRSGSVAQGAGGIDHVIDKDAGTAFNVANDVHDFGDVGLGPTLVDDRQVHTQGLGYCTGANHAADVGGDDHQILEALRLDVIDQDRRAVDVVHGHVEEALDLIGVQVDGEDAVDAHHIEHVGHDLGADRHARRARTAVLAGVAKVGDHGCDASGGRTAEGVCHYHQFHQVVVGRCAGRLDQEDVLAANIFIDFDTDFAVGKLSDVGITEGDVQLTYDTPGQIGVGVPREDHHLGHAQYLPEGGSDEIKSCSKGRAF